MENHVCPKSRTEVRVASWQKWLCADTKLGTSMVAAKKSPFLLKTEFDNGKYIISSQN